MNQSDEYKIKLVNEFKASSLVVDKFLVDKNISLKKFCKWIVKYIQEEDANLFIVKPNFKDALKDIIFVGVMGFVFVVISILESLDVIDFKFTFLSYIASFFLFIGMIMLILALNCVMIVKNDLVICRKIKGKILVFNKKDISKINVNPKGGLYIFFEKKYKVAFKSGDNSYILLCKYLELKDKDEVKI